MTRGATRSDAGGDHGTPQPIGLGPIQVPTMGRYGPIRLKPEVTYRGEGKDAIATVRTPNGLTFTILAEDWRRLVMRFGGVEMPAIYPRRSDKGSPYLCMMIQGVADTVARILHALRGLALHSGLAVQYRDKDPNNLTWANLLIKGRREAAEAVGAL